MYTPNFTDPRVQKRTRLALAFIERTFVIHNTTISLSNRLIHSRDNLGMMNDNLSKYLRRLLLVVVNDTFRFNSDFNRSKQYRVNYTGYQYLTKILNQETQLTWAEYRQQHVTSPEQTEQEYNEQLADRLFQKHSDEIASGLFDMKTKSNRDYHSLQFIPNTIRDRKFAKQGYIHVYDIQACAVTLLVQQARRNGLTQATPAIEKYTQDRTRTRHTIANETGCSYDQVKRAITSLFQGSRLTHMSRIYPEVFDSNYPLMIAFSQHPLVCELKEQIRLLWPYLLDESKRTWYLDRNGVRKRKPFSGQQKAQVYRELEQQVMRSVKKFIKRSERSCRLMTEHDGWRTDRLIDLPALEDYVRQQTGFDIRIDHKQVKDSTDVESTLQISSISSSLPVAHLIKKDIY